MEDIEYYTTDNTIRMIGRTFKQYQKDSEDFISYEDQFKLTHKEWRELRHAFEEEIGEKVHVIENRDYFAVDALVIRQAWVPHSLEWLWPQYRVPSDTPGIMGTYVFHTPEVRQQMIGMDEDESN